MQRENAEHPRATSQTLQASFRVSNVKVHDSTIKKQTKQVWLVWKSCQEKVSSL